MNSAIEYLPENMDCIQSFTCTSLHLEVLDFSDISLSDQQKADSMKTSKRSICVDVEEENYRHTNDTSPAFKLLVTDKNDSHALAFELERRLDSKKLIGKQIVLKGKIDVFNGIIFLDSKNSIYFDGNYRNSMNQSVYDFEIPSDCLFSE